MNHSLHTTINPICYPKHKLIACTRHITLPSDILGPRAFAPVKGDINGNLKKLQGHFNANPEGAASLQSMVQIEIDVSALAGHHGDSRLFARQGNGFMHPLWCLDPICRAPERIVVAGVVWT